MNRLVLLAGFFLGGMLFLWVGDVEAGDDETTTPLEIISRVLEDGDHVMAKSLLDNLLERPDVGGDERAVAIMLEASIALDQGDLHEAVVWLHSWLDQYPGHQDAPYVHFLLGQTYMELDAYQRARDAFYRTLSSTVLKASNDETPTGAFPVMLSKVAKWALAETEYQEGHWERARELFRRFKKQDPEVKVLVEGAIYREADCTYQLKDVKGAVEGYENAVAVGPFHPFAPEAWLRLVQLYGIQKNKKKQGEALEGFIWLVRQFDVENTEYWQRRCGAFLLANWDVGVEGQAEILEALSAVKPSDALDGVRNHYLRLLNRRTEAKVLAELPEVDKAWIEWKHDFQKTHDSIQSKIQELEQRKVREDDQ